MYSVRSYNGKCDELFETLTKTYYGLNRPDQGNKLFILNFKVTIYKLISS